MKKIILTMALSFSNVVFSSPIDACITSVNMALQGAANQAAMGNFGGLGTPGDIQNRMTIAMSKANCYGNLDQSKLCQIKLDAMMEVGKVATKQGGGKNVPLPDASLMQMAKQISGC